METEITKENWLREKTMVYCLHQVGWNKGKPLMSNKFYFRVYPDYRIENAEQEAERIAKKMAAVDDLMSALQLMVDRVESGWDTFARPEQNGLKTAFIAEAKEALKKATE